MNKVLLVTGAGRGIGASIAQRASMDGYAVAINYVRDEQSARELADVIVKAGGSAVTVQGDVGDRSDVDRMFALTESALGPVTALVNNAGITGRLGRFIDADPESIDRIFRTNVIGTMNCCRVALRAFKRHAVPGVIVNISSIAARTGSPGEYVHYAASKAAVETFTLGLAREHALDGIRICAVSPGSTLTEIHAAAGEPDRPARVAPNIPMRRLADPREIAEPVVWLLSDAASYITGATIPCTGGL